MLSDDFNFVSPAYDPALQEQCKHCYEVKAAGDVLPYNYDYAFYSSETMVIMYTSPQHLLHY